MRKEVSVSPLKPSNKMKKLIMKQLRLHKKAESVMSNNPPNSEFASSFKAKYIKASRLIYLPPIPIRLKPPSPCISYFPLPRRTQRQKSEEIGVLHGMAKCFTIRRRSKSQNSHPIHPLNSKFPETGSDIEISPMTILVKLKENNFQ